MTEADAASWVPLTTHEIFYLLSLGDGPANELSHARLGVPKVSDDSDMILAGASTLLVRGLAKQVDEAVEPVDQAALLAWLLSTAGKWLEVGVTTGEVADALLVAANDDVAVVLTPGSFGIFQFMIIDAGESPGNVAMAFVQSVFDSNPAAAVSARRIGVDVETSSGASVENNRWRFVSSLPESVPPGLEPVPADCTRAEALEQLASVLRS